MLDIIFKAIRIQAVILLYERHFRLAQLGVVFLQVYWDDFLFGVHGCGVSMALVGNMLLFNVLAIHGILCSILPCFVSQNMAFYFMKGGILNAW